MKPTNKMRVNAALALSAGLALRLYFIHRFPTNAAGDSEIYLELARNWLIAYLPLSLTIIGASGLASRFVDRFTPKPVLVAGLLISTIGFVLLTRVSGHGDYASHVAPAMVVLGAGLGTSFVPITIAATNGVAPGDSGLASGLLNTTQQVGGSLGLAILSSVSTSRVTARCTPARRYRRH